MTESGSAIPGSGQLDAVFERAARFNNEEEVQADYARYLCVLVTGFLERSVARVFQDYVDTEGDSRISDYVSKSLRLGRSMRVDNMLRLVGDFDENWKDILSNNLTEQHRQAIGNLYEHRNKIAHGEDSDLTYRQVHHIYNLVKETIGFLEAIIRPDSTN